MKIQYKKYFNLLSIIAAISIIPSVIFAQVGNNTEVLNPNTSRNEDIAKVNHISADLAKKIMENKPFLNMIDFNNLLSKSLNEEQVKEVYVKLFVPINLNNAAEEEIFMVPGVGRKMKHEFEEYRPYVNLKVFRREMSKYVDDKEVARLEQYVYVPININNASDDDIMTIPGMGRKMLHEFKEYRPYKAIAQFRREMGKYVDDKEVARLEKYIIIK